jgi:hypothetical protein
MAAMPLTGEFAPSRARWARRQVELYEATGGAEGNDLRGRPIIVLTMSSSRMARRSSTTWPAR